MMTSSASNREMKVEPDFGSLSFAKELLHLRARVQELEQGKAQVEAENRQLKDLLVNEIPSLLAAMKQSICESTAEREMGSELLQSLSPGDAFTQSVLSSPGHVGGVELLQNTPSSTDQPDSTGFMQAMSRGSAELSGNNFIPAEEDSCTLCPVIFSDEDCPTCPSSACSSPDFVPVREMEHLHMSGHSGNHLHQVEVYPGSSVFCEARAWHSAIKAHSPTAMARMLLLGVFDMDTLLQSNLRGGRSRRPAFPNHRIGLDPHKLDAIYNATLARFPLARKGQIGTGINSKLSEIRFRSRRANQERRYL
ncbi:uncharacterized protein LOC108942615 [Arapaima gigas]